MKNFVIIFAYILSVSLVIGLPASRLHSPFINNEDDNNNEPVEDQFDPKVEDDSGAVDFDVAETNRSKKSAATTFCVEIKSGTPECVPCQSLLQGVAPPQVIYVTDNNTKQAIDTYNNTIVHRTQEIPVPIQECKKENDDMFVIIAPPQQPAQPQVSFVQVPIVHPPPAEAPQVLLAKGPEVIEKYFPGLLNESNVQAHQLIPLDSMGYGGMFNFSTPSMYSNLEPVDLKNYRDLPTYQHVNYQYPQIPPNFSQYFEPTLNQSQIHIPSFHPNVPHIYPSGPQSFQPSDVPVQPGYGFMSPEQHKVFYPNFPLTNQSQINIPAFRPNPVPINPSGPQSLQPGHLPVQPGYGSMSPEQHEVFYPNFPLTNQFEINIPAFRPNPVPINPSGPHSLQPGHLPVQSGYGFTSPEQNKVLYPNFPPTNQSQINIPAFRPNPPPINPSSPQSFQPHLPVQFGHGFMSPDQNKGNVNVFNGHLEIKGGNLNQPHPGTQPGPNLKGIGGHAVVNPAGGTIEQHESSSFVVDQQGQLTINGIPVSEFPSQAADGQSRGQVYPDVVPPQFLPPPQYINSHPGGQIFLNGRVGQYSNGEPANVNSGGVSFGMPAQDGQAVHMQYYIDQKGKLYYLPVAAPDGNEPMCMPNEELIQYQDKSSIKNQNIQFSQDSQRQFMYNQIFGQINQQPADNRNVNHQASFNQHGFAATNQQPVNNQNLYNNQGYVAINKLKNNQDINNQPGFAVNLSANLQKSNPQGFAANNQNYLNFDYQPFMINQLSKRLNSNQQGFAANQEQLNNQNGKNLLQFNLQSNGQLINDQNFNQRQLKNFTFNQGQMGNEKNYYGPSNQQNLNNKNFQSFSQHSFATNQPQNIENSNQHGLSFQHSASLNSKWSSKDVDEDGNIQQIIKTKNYTSPFKLIAQQESKSKSGSSNLLLSPTKGSSTLPKTKNLIDRKGTKGNDKRGIKRETDEMSSDKE